MINTQPHHDKLNKLQEYLFAKIERGTHLEVWMDLQVCPDDFYLKMNLPLPKPYKKQVKIFAETFLEYLTP